VRKGAGSHAGFDGDDRERVCVSAPIDTVVDAAVPDERTARANP